MGRNAIASRRSSRGSRRWAFASACSSTPNPIPIQWAASAGADRVELYTEPFARAFERGAGERRGVRSRSMRRAPRLAHSLGLGVNAGHDLDLDNLVMFRELPFLAEVSIGHALDVAGAVRGPAGRGPRIPRPCCYDDCSCMKSDGDCVRHRRDCLRPDRRLDYRHPAGDRAHRRAGAGGGLPLRPRLAEPRAALLDEAKVTALKSVAEREPANAKPRVELANLYLRRRAVRRSDHVVRGRAEAEAQAT